MEFRRVLFRSGILVGNEDAAARGPHAERIEKILSDTRAGEALRLADARHVPRSREKSGELFERPDLAPNLQEIAAEQATQPQAGARRNIRSEEHTSELQSR